MNPRWLMLSCALAFGCASNKLAPATAARSAAAASSDANARSSQEAKTKALIDRAKALELPTAYVPPPGDPLSLDAAGFAETMCSAVFITGLDLDFAAEHVGYFTAPYETRKQLGKPIVDRAARRVDVPLPKGGVESAVYTDGQGCVTLPEGSNRLAFTPEMVKPNLVPAASQTWPMGDVLDQPFPRELDKQKIDAAVDALFEPPSAETAAVVITWRGQIIGERYAKGISDTTPLESWSMGKSIIGTLMGMLIQQGVYKLDQPAPVPEWQDAGDPRAKITIADLFHMSSGLRIRAPYDPEAYPDTNHETWDIDGTLPAYPDHIYFYTGAIDAFKYAATRPLQWPPNTVGRYRNTDPLLLGYLTRLAVEKRHEDYLAFPQRALFDKLGIRTAVLETDPFGNMLTNGYDLMSARDWARLGNLYLRDGVAQDGERLLPEGFTKFVSTPAPAWVADGRPIYGGMFWLGSGKVLSPRLVCHVGRRQSDGGDCTCSRSRHRTARVLQGLARIRSLAGVQACGGVARRSTSEGVVPSIILDSEVGWRGTAWLARAGYTSRMDSKADERRRARAAWTSTVVRDPAAAEQADLEFWLSMTPDQRVELVAKLSLEAYRRSVGDPDARPKLQRSVVRISRP